MSKDSNPPTRLLSFTSMTFREFMKAVRWKDWREDFKDGFRDILDGGLMLIRGLALVLLRAIQYPLTPIGKPISGWILLKQMREVERRKGKTREQN